MAGERESEGSLCKYSHVAEPGKPREKATVNEWGVVYTTQPAAATALSLSLSLSLSLCPGSIKLDFLCGFCVSFVKGIEDTTSCVGIFRGEIIKWFLISPLLVRLRGQCWAGLCSTSECVTDNIVNCANLDLEEAPLMTAKEAADLNGESVSAISLKKIRYFLGSNTVA